MIFDGNDITELNVDDDIFFMDSVNEMSTHELNMQAQAISIAERKE